MYWTTSLSSSLPTTLNFSTNALSVGKYTNKYLFNQSTKGILFFDILPSKPWHNTTKIWVSSLLDSTIHIYEHLLWEHSQEMLTVDHVWSCWKLKVIVKSKRKHIPFTVTNRTLTCHQKSFGEMGDFFKEYLRKKVYSDVLSKVIPYMDSRILNEIWSDSNLLKTAWIFLFYTKYFV